MLAWVMDWSEWAWVSHKRCDQSLGNFGSEWVVSGWWSSSAGARPVGKYSLSGPTLTLDNSIIERYPSVVTLNL